MKVNEFGDDIANMLNVAVDDMKLDPRAVLNAALLAVCAFTVARLKNPEVVFRELLGAASNDAMNAAAEMKVKGR